MELQKVGFEPLRAGFSTHKRGSLAFGKNSPNAKPEIGDRYSSHPDSLGVCKRDRSVEVSRALPLPFREGSPADSSVRSITSSAASDADLGRAVAPRLGCSGVLSSSDERTCIAMREALGQISYSRPCDREPTTVLRSQEGVGHVEQRQLENLTAPECAFLFISASYIDLNSATVTTGLWQSTTRVNLNHLPM